MIYLWLVTLIWAFSFGLIKGELTGLPSSFVAMVRMAISLLVFVPFFRPQVFTSKRTLRLALLGAVQFGAMYVLYIQSYQYLQAHEVAVLTITTPFFVTLIADFFQKRFAKDAFLWVMLCLAGSLIITFAKLDSVSFWKGLLLVQLANFCFAWGQVVYKRYHQQDPMDDTKAFVPMYFGAVVVTTASAMWQADVASIDVSYRQWWVLLYLGVLPSGLGFFLWNKGATKVKAARLAIMNNMKIPAAIVVAMLLFGEEAHLLRLGVGSALIVFALWMAGRKSATSITPHPGA